MVQTFGEISENMRENSNEEAPDIGKRVSPSDQLEQEVQHNARTSRAAVSQDSTDKKILFSYQQKKELIPALACQLMRMQ
ncbi:MAG: hypothetical protein ACR5KV_07690 [Wolbachia sp.]